MVVKKNTITHFFVIGFIFFYLNSYANAVIQTTLKDSVLGSLNPYRTWWDVLFYNIEMMPNIEQKTIAGSVEIDFKAIKTNHILQIDLQAPLMIDSIFEIAFLNKRRSGSKIRLQFKTEAHRTLLKFNKSILKNQIKKIKFFYHGTPHEALKAPWDGGVVWSKDSFNNPFISVACQGIGASIWFPCKDHLSDEPDSGMQITIHTPDTLIGVANGKLLYQTPNIANKSIAWTWRVINPINNYNINFSIAKYKNWSDTLNGKNGILNLNFWVLEYNLLRSKNQFKIVKPIIHTFEKWFGAYPFYADDYKIIETPFLGMEHQSGIAYGNNFQNGYRGKDLSKTGIGLLWDFILVHETGHEWFGNSLSINDRADMWINESFTNYSESIFTEELFGYNLANDYCFGTRSNIKNDQPIIPQYGINAEGSGDMYYKGGNMWHTIRNAVYDDKKWRNFLLFLNAKYFHKNITTKNIETELNVFFGFNFKNILSQYLQTTQIPILNYYFEDENVFFKWIDCVVGFNLPLILPIKKDFIKIYPTDKWQKKTIKNFDKNWLLDKKIEKFFLIQTRKTEQ